MQMAAAYSFLVETAWKSTAILGAVWLAVWLLRKRSAAVRHLAWTVAFAGMFALPLLSVALPGLRVPVEDARALPAFLFAASTTAGVQGHDKQQDKKVGEVAAAAAQVWDWRMLMTLLWGAGAALSLTQMLIGYVTLNRIGRRANVSAAQQEVASLARLLNVKGEVELRETDAGSMPMTYGLWRSSIFVPADARDWSAERRRIVLLHELAHVRRGDNATHLLGRAVVSLYWWNPLAWAGWRQFVKERERAADDLVLAAGTGRAEYAGHLFEIARSMQGRPAFGWTGVAMASHSQLEGRLSAILATVRDRKAPRRASAIVAMVLALAMIAPFAALRAEAERMQAVPGSAAVDGPMAVGDEARENGKFEQAKAAYSKVLEASGSGPRAATAFLHRGTVEVATEEYAAAIRDFEKAQAEDSSRLTEAVMWTALAQQRQNNLAGAAALYQRALATADPYSTIAATIRDMFARLLEQQGLPDEAKQMRRQAEEARQGQVARAKTASQGVSGEVFRAGGEVKAPTLKSKVEPQYTEEARIAKYSGTVLLRVTVGDDGLTHDLAVVRGLGFGLDEKAMEAVSQWTFAPGSKDGHPVKVSATIEVNFRLL